MDTLTNMKNPLIVYGTVKEQEPPDRTVWIRKAGKGTYPGHAILSGMAGTDAVRDAYPYSSEVHFLSSREIRRMAKPEEMNAVISGGNSFGVISAYTLKQLPPTNSLRIEFWGILSLPTPRK